MHVSLAHSLCMCVPARICVCVYVSACGPLPMCMPMDFSCVQTVEAKLIHALLNYLASVHRLEARSRAGVKSFLFLVLLKLDRFPAHCIADWREILRFLPGSSDRRGGGVSPMEVGLLVLTLSLASTDDASTWLKMLKRKQSARMDPLERGSTHCILAILTTALQHHDE
jgi:hypothetical protein